MQPGGQIDERRDTSSPGDRALRRNEHAAEARQQRRLAGTVGAHDAETLARRQLDRHVAQGPPHRAVAPPPSPPRLQPVRLPEAVYPKYRVHQRPCSPARTSAIAAAIAAAITPTGASSPVQRRKAWAA